MATKKAANTKSRIPTQRSAPKRGPEAGVLKRPDFVPDDIAKIEEEWLDDYERDLMAMLEKCREADEKSRKARGKGRKASK